MTAFALSVVSFSARKPKSITFWWCPGAKVASPPTCPSSVPAAAEPPASAAASDPNGTAPAKPPFPACWYLPFHPEAGSQTSRPMCESGLGVETTTTRQNAGRLLKTWRLGAVNEPAGTDCARVTVACGSESPVRLLQVAAVAGAAESAVAAIAVTRNVLRSIVSSSLWARCGRIGDADVTPCPLARSRRAESDRGSLRRPSHLETGDSATAERRC